jgi:Zn-dependent M28 family amino/carboxypeptidase
VLAIAVACESSGPTSVPPPQIEEAVNSITFEDVRADIETIAHDSMQGRATPSPGLESTAQYVAARFADAGLQPGGTEGFFQRFDRPEVQNAVNTIGWLEGSDPGLRDEYVIFTAHMDHLGTGIKVDGDSIYNGADDNASGTAVLLELAEAFATLDTRPRRSLVFIALSAEELGLLGAFHYTDNPTFPIESTVANVNMDMVGRNDPGSIAALRSSEEIGHLAENVGDGHSELGLEVTGDLWPGQNLIRRSDQWAFIRLGVPALFFHSGLHTEYHTPFDEADRIDFDKTVRVAKMLFHVGLELATTDLPPS